MSAPAPPGRRERKKLATRTAVSAAALRLAVRHGVEHVTVERIATEADIALRTFFNHFPSKEDAILAASAAGADALVAEFRSRPRGESVFGALREAVLVVMDRTDAAGRDHLAALRLIRTAPSLVPHQLAVLARQETALAAAIGERVGGGVSPVYPELCAAAALAALRVTLDRWLGGDPGDATPPLDVLRADVDSALAELAAGLDRPGA
ncbi:TetR/AcrR family transcriptional regulator [Pseudonocardia broussonetiae]|uniref:TetR family transcriptional regulator n=1 Tax=Pseudonocardia broussonetiae TaxID=2736640 RepID=A0A6M6JDM3_9PSEU|nr:TetR/AcrR family transcriptional regulator [Pseudonocardia broussonetiae]QJY45170.1 TetR family transcriptional regulator [Pseudonocardia broussonetiae]